MLFIFPGQRLRLRKRAFNEKGGDEERAAWKLNLHPVIFLILYIMCWTEIKQWLGLQMSVRKVNLHSNPWLYVTRRWNCSWCCITSGEMFLYFKQKNRPKSHAHLCNSFLSLVIQSSNNPLCCQVLSLSLLFSCACSVWSRAAGQSFRPGRDAPCCVHDAHHEWPRPCWNLCCLLYDLCPGQ